MSEREILTNQWKLIAERLGIQFVGQFQLSLADGGRHEFAVLPFHSLELHAAHL